MYQKARTQRAFNPNHVTTPKVELGQYLQTIVTKKGDLKLIVHDRATKNQVDMVKFRKRHGIHSGMVIANGFKKPKGIALHAQRELIRLKKSSLSAKERAIVMAD